MAFPKIAKVTHEAVVPSTGKKIKYRPFLVKEEKVLILARESDSDAEMFRAINDIIDACVLTKDFDVNTLSTFDVEYLFLRIRATSIGDDVNVIITCPDDGETKVEEVIPLSHVKVVFDDEHETDIKIDEEYSLKMKYPTYKDTVEMASHGSDEISFAESLELIASCIDILYTEEESYSSSDESLENMVKWVEELEAKSFAKIEKFFETMPKLSYTVKVTNPNTGVESEVILEGLGSFFA